MPKEKDDYTFENLLKFVWKGLLNSNLNSRIISETNQTNIENMAHLMENAYKNKTVCLIELIGNRYTGKW